MRTRTTAAALVAASFFTLVGGPIDGQVKGGKEVPKDAKSSDDFTVTVKKLSVSAKAAPMPRLRYRLMPSYSQKVEGNAAVPYFRAMMSLTSRNAQIQKDLKTPEAIGKFYVADREHFNQLIQKPRGDIPLAEIRKFIEERDSKLALREIRNGTSCEACDWELKRKIATENIELILPEIQNLRELTQLLKYRSRLAAIEGKPEESLDYIRDGIVLGKRAAEGNTLISMLVGIAMVSIELGEIEYLIQQPEAPNLYWALTDLPTPLLSTKEVVDGELRGFDSLLAGLREADGGPMAEAKAQELFVRLTEMLRKVSGGGDAKASPLEEFGMKAGLTLMIGAQQDSSRKTLKAVGKTEKEIEAMSPTQRYLVAEWFVCQDIRDTLFATFHLPIPQALKEFEKQERELKRLFAGSQSVNPLRTLLLMLVPAMQKAHEAHRRLERMLAALKTVEAIRLYAAKEGKLPEKLADITEVSLPNDPLFDRPIEYKFEGGKGILLLQPPAGDKLHMGNNFRYEIELKKP